MKLFRLLLHKFTDLVKLLDKEKNISHDLYRLIVKVYENTGDIAISGKQVEYCINLNGTIVHLLKKLNEVARNKELYLELVEVLFQSGLKGIENNLDDLIRNVSNHLGWICKNAIDNNDRDKIKIILEKVSLLFNLSVDFGSDVRTTIFIGTLFIVLGGYSCSIKNLGIRKLVISNIKNLKRRDLLNKSKMIRENQSITWDAVMNNDAKKNIEIFWAMISDELRQ